VAKITKPWRINSFCAGYQAAFARCGRKCSFKILTNPPGSTSLPCNVLILLGEFQVGNLVPNQIQPILLGLLESMTSISLMGDEMRPSMLDLVEAC
jgi:hypothetical protein